MNKQYSIVLSVLISVLLIIVVSLMITVRVNLETISKINKCLKLNNNTNTIQNKILLNYGKRIRNLEEEENLCEIKNELKKY